MNDFNTYEYVVDQKLKGAQKLRKVGLVLFYIIFVVGWLIFGFWSKMFPLLALCPVTLWMAVFFTWRYVQVEFEYSAVSGLVTFAAVYGNRSRKKLCEVKIKDCVTIAPANDKYLHLVDRYAPVNALDCRSCEDAEDGYFMLAEINGKKTVIYFEATEKFLKICRFYNAAATTESKVRF